jgi:type II secretory pathway component PulF
MSSLPDAWRQLDDSRHRAAFYRQWHLAAAAGFTVPRAMESAGTSESHAVEASRLALLQGTRARRTITSVVQSPAAPFPPFDAALLSLGDETGRLDQSLRLLGEYHERRQRWMLAVRKRLAYPMFTGLAATVIAPFPLVVAGRLGAYAVTVLLGCGSWMLYGGGIVHAAARRFAREPRLVRARLARGLAIAVEAGLPLDRALPLAAAASGDDRIRDAVNGLGARRLATQPLTVSLERCPGLTPEFLAILGNAERTGDFTGTLVRLADLYDDGFR